MLNQYSKNSKELIQLKDNVRIAHTKEILKFISLQGAPDADVEVFNEDAFEQWCPVFLSPRTGHYQANFSVDGGWEGGSKSYLVII